MGRMYLSFAVLLLLASLHPGRAAAQQPVVVFLEGRLTTLSTQLEELETREYICRRTLYPADMRIVERYHSWIGEDTDSLYAWEQVYTLTDNLFTLERPGTADGSGELTGRMWSWSEISYEYTDAQGRLVKFSGKFSGQHCSRAGVVLDEEGELYRLLKDESNIVSEEQYVMMQAIYARLSEGYN